MTNDARDQTPRDADDGERLLDRAIESARSGPSPEIMTAAAARVRQRLFEQAPAGASPCSVLRPELPDLVAGTLSEARAALVADHCRECVPCRKELVALRQGPVAPAVAVTAIPVRPAFGRRFGVAFALAAAVLAAAILAFGLAGNGPAAEATVAGLSGHLLDAASGRQLAEGDTIAEGRAVRTAKGSRAVLALPDGSRVELNERAQASFDADGNALTVSLLRGDLIFEAAPRRERNLFVKTDDCVVAVKGTIFTVRHGMKGSRVGVLEGSVHVDDDGQLSVLGPGQQVATDPSLQPQDLHEQVGWSLESARWTTLLGEIEAAAAAVEQSFVPAAPRFRSAILDAMPDSAVLFAAAPNDGELAALAREISERVADNPDLRDWWQAQLGEGGKDRPGLALVLDTLGRLSASLGDEVVLALLETGADSSLQPVLAAGVKDEAGLRQLVADLAPEGHAPRFLDAAELAAEPEGTEHEPLLVMHAGHVLASPSATALRAIVAGFDAPPQHGSGFLEALEGRYDRGAEILVGADLGRSVARRAERAASDASARGEELPGRIIDALGIPSVDQFVLTAGAADPGTAVLSFTDRRSGVAAWLAEPGPMGSLQFVTPEATVAVAALMAEPKRMLADLGAALPEGHLEDFVTRLSGETGVDLHDDLAAALGGEMALALDGPVLPMPSWKLILEVDDAGVFDAALQRLAETASEKAKQEGLAVTEPLLRQTSTSEGPAQAVRLGTLELHYAFRNGYFVATPSLPLLESALQASARGRSLDRSAKLLHLLPGGRHDEVSLLAWQDLSQVLGAGTESAASMLPPEAAAMLRSAGGPSIGWGRASDHSIAFGLNTEEGGLGAGLSGLLRRHLVQGLAHHALTSREGAGEDAAPVEE